MKKRTFLFVMLVVMVILSITPLYITPASACEEKPKVEIWKKFLDTSDPPPYQLRTEYHWDIEIGVWTSINLKNARVYDRFGAELKIDTIKTSDKTYTFTYIDYEDKYPTKQAYVSISDGTTTITHKLSYWRGLTFGKEPYKFRIYWIGETHKIHFEWIIGELKADETITIIVGVSTDLNPGGKQEYTSPCEHCINSGATLKATWRDRCRWRCISAESEKLYVKVQCEEPRPAKLILDKFNDTNGNGIYDDGDIKIPNWEIDVKDPDGVTTTYLTPKIIDITEFGTYAITEDLPTGWIQTAVFIDDIPVGPPPTLMVTVEINEGETHNVLYGNRVTAPPTPPRIEISLGIVPNIQSVGSIITFSWTIDSPPESTPVKVELKLIDQYGVETVIYTGTTFPADFTGSKTWTATGPTGSWKARVIYYYKYAGYDLTARATQGFVVTP